MEWIALEGEYPSPSWPPIDPAMGETVEVLVTYGGMYFIARYRRKDKAWISTGLYSSERIDTPSHWMPLPALPGV